MSNSISGKINDVPLQDVIEQLRQSKATGILSVRCKDIVKCIYLKTGQIVFATSTDIYDRLGEILVRSGKLTRENLDHALHLHKKGAGLKKLGAILVENGLINPKDLFNGLKMQVKDIICSLFLWTEGEYSFSEHLPPDLIHLQINFQELIAEVIQRMRQEA